MEKRILLEMRGKKASEIKELVLDNCHTTSIDGLTEEFCNLETLSIVNAGLTNLKGFPKLPNLKKLELSDNRISGGLNNLSNCPKLNALYLGGNKIDSLETLEPLKELSSLEHLELTNCEITSIENYQDKVFKLLPNLKFLDGFDQNGKELDECEAENGKAGKFNGEDKDSDVSEDSEEEEEEEDEDEDDDEDEEEECDDSDEEELGLLALQKDIIDEESEGDDYNPTGEVSEDEEIEDDSGDEVTPSKNTKSPRGEKRKLESDE